MRHLMLAMMAVSFAAAAAGPPPVDETTVATTRVESGNGVMLDHPWTLSVQGGVEGYSSTIGGILAPGATYGASLQLEPWRFLGFEAGYSGAVNELRLDTNSSVVRNGGYVVITPGWSFPLGATDETDLKPYAMGGVGFDSYNLTSNAAGQGFTAATTATIPYGAGLRLRVGRFSFDGRWTSVAALSNALTTNAMSSVRTQGLLQAGVNF